MRLASSLLLASLPCLAISGCPAAPAGGTPCDTDLDCPAGEYCEGGGVGCTFICRDDVDCLEHGGGPCSSRGRCDGTSPDGGTRDGGARDAAGPCAGDADCDDGVFCNGAEVCDGSAVAADARGCAPATVARCAAGVTCNEAMDRCESGCDVDDDVDGDGFASTACGGNDCDDGDPLRYPANMERCDGLVAAGVSAANHDEDCNPCTINALAPDGDADADLYPSDACSNPWLETGDAHMFCDPNRTRVDDVGRTVHGADCNDDPSMGGANIRPNQAEVCDGVDNNCDAMTDMATLYRDRDDDGRGDPDDTMVGVCAPGWVTNAEDCDDTRAWTYLGALEICDGRDNDCSLAGAGAGGVDAAEDQDGDGHSRLTAACSQRGEPSVADFLPAYYRDDCNDSDATSYPGADEECGNGIDENCNGVPDDPTRIVCLDRDGDGSGDTLTRRTIMSCTVPSGEVARCVGAEADCDDTSANGPRRFPGNPEVCDRIDNDCSTPTTPAALDEDVDGDGYAPPGASCLGPTESGVPTAFPRTDCDDTTETRHPGATEFCDGLDQDCDAGTDETFPTLGMPCDGSDADGCRHGVFACNGPSAVSCTDDPVSVAEVCDAAGVDEDCSGGPDPRCLCAIDGPGLACGSGLPGCASGTRPCDPLPGGGSAYRAACSVTDTLITCWADSDNDGYAALGASTSPACACAPGTTATAPTSTAYDCDTIRGDIRPNAPEVCDGVDNNCSAPVDPGTCTLGTTWNREDECAAPVIDTCGAASTAWCDWGARRANLGAVGWFYSIYQAETSNNPDCSWHDTVVYDGYTVRDRDSSVYGYPVCPNFVVSPWTSRVPQDTVLVARTYVRWDGCVQVRLSVVDDRGNLLGQNGPDGIVFCDAGSTTIDVAFRTPLRSPGYCPRFHMVVDAMEVPSSQVWISAFQLFVP